MTTKNTATIGCILIAWVLVSWPGYAAEEPVFTPITDSPISESYAFSAAWGDCDGDGFIDLLFADPYQGVWGQTQIYLFHNQGDGSFTKQVLDSSAFQHSG